MTKVYGSGTSDNEPKLKSIRNDDRRILLVVWNTSHTSQKGSTVCHRSVSVLSIISKPGRIGCTMAGELSRLVKPWKSPLCVKFSPKCANSEIEQYASGWELKVGYVCKISAFQLIRYHNDNDLLKHCRLSTVCCSNNTRRVTAYPDSSGMIAKMASCFNSNRNLERIAIAEAFSLL